MKKKNFSESRIFSIIKQYEGGRAIDDLCRRNGISKATVYNLKKKYTGMDGVQVRELKSLQEENKRLKHIYTELRLDYKLAKEIIEKKL